MQKCNLDQAAVSAASDSRRIAASVHAHLRALFSLCHFSEREAAVLRCATLFPPDGISVSLLQTCLSQLTGEDIFRIVQRGWLNCQNNLLTVHPTVRAVLQEVLKPSDQNCYTFLSTLEKESDRMDFDLTILRQMAVVFSMAAGFLEDAKGNWALNAGKLWIRLNEGSQALKHICPVLERWQKCPPENPQNLISAYHQAGVSYMYQNDFKQAEKHLTAALAQSAPDNPQRATYLNNLATVYNRLGDYGQSLKYSLEALKRQNNSRNPLTLASVYNNIGLAYAGLEDHSSALMYQEKALQLHQDTLPVDHPDFAASLNNIGMAYAQQGKQDSALEYLKRALVIREKLYHENHPSIVTSCNNIGGLFSAKGNYDEALKYLYRAVSIGETVLPKGHPDLAAAYGNLGAAYEMQNRNLEALDFYKKAVVAIQVGSSENRTQLANYLALAAFVNAKLSNFAEAIQFMRQAIDCIQDSLPEDHPVLTNYQKYLDAFERIQQSSGEFGAIYRSSQTEANAE